jgi:predicted permease
MRRRREDDLEREISAHLELEAEEQRDGGRSPEEARYAARRAFGNTLLIKEDVRATWRWASLESVRQDLSYAFRVLRKSPGFTAATLFSLTVGIGLNSSVFSVLNAILLRPLPAPESERLVRVFQDDWGNTSYPNYRDLRTQSTTLEGMAAYSWPNPVALSDPSSRDGARTEQVWSAAVSANYFDVLGVRAQRGRMFLPEEERATGAAPVVVLSDALWRRRFQADPAVVGRAVRINGHPFEVIGVAPPDVPQPEALFAHQLWVPVVMCAEVGIGDRLASRRQNWLRTIGRLRRDAAFEGLRSEVPVIAARIEAAAPQDARGLRFTPYPETRARLVSIPGARRLAWILQALVAIVLAIACVNIASLQLARSLSRGREIATRMAIGAGRGRIVRQFVTESLLLAFGGGLLGLLAAVWGGRLLLRLAPPFPRSIPLALDVAPDGRVLAFGLALALVIGVVFGVATALVTVRAGLNPRLKSGDLATRSRGWFAPGHLLVGGQVALSAVLLVAALLFLQSLANASRMGLGFRPENRLSVSVSPGMQRYADAEIRRLHAEGLERMRALPGVTSASSTIMLPLTGGYLGDGYVSPEGDAEPTERGRPMVFFDRVGPGYFDTMGATLLRGREFAEQDGPLARQVAVVNETFAHGFWPGEDPVGKRFRTGGVTGPLIEIVGVVSDGKYHSLGEGPQRHVYQPFLQGHAPSSFTFVLRTSGDTRGVAAAARATLRQFDPALPVIGVQTIGEHLAFAFWGPRVGATLVGVFALLGLALSATGLYGVLGFLVSRRVREIGVRMALGASPGNVLWLFLRRGLAMAAGGAVLGLFLAMAAARGLSRHLYGVPAWNATAFGSVAVLLLAVALLTCYLPSRRAVKIDPLCALRQD